MLSKAEIEKSIDDFFSGSYLISEGRVIPNIEDISFGKNGKEIEACILFIDIRESTKIVDNLRRITAAKMYKSFLWGVAKIARENGGELRSFNGDGVLIVFMGESKNTNSAKSALQMNWFGSQVLKPKLDTIFSSNSGLSKEGIEFNFGIGIDVGKILVVRGGIRGENNNDLVWVGNATNYAVKLSNHGDKNFRIRISESVYNEMSDSTKIGGNPKINMWEKFSSDELGIYYRSNWIWKLN